MARAVQSSGIRRNSIYGVVVLAAVLCLLVVPWSAGRAFALPGEEGVQCASLSSVLASDAARLSATGTSSVFKPALNKKKLSLVFGETANLTVKYAAGKNVKWTTSNKKTVKVSKAGRLTTVAAGSAVVSAKVGGKTLKCKVSVRPKLSATSVALNRDASKKLTAKGGTPVSWKSSNPKVAKIVETSKKSVKVKAVAAGKAMVTATINGKVSKCVVKVKGELNASKVTLTPFTTKQLKLKGAFAKSWKSANPSIVEVTSTGLLKPGSAGAVGATKIVCTDNLGFKYECDVVNEAPGIEFSSPYSFGINYDYYTIFVLTNNTGREIVFADTDIIYRSYGDSNNCSVLKGMRSGYVDDDYLSDSPLAVSEGAWVQFNAYKGYFPYGVDFPSYADPVYEIIITIDGKKYTCVLATDGVIRSFAPAPA